MRKRRGILVPLASLMFLNFLNAGIPDKPLPQTLVFTGLQKRSLSPGPSPLDNPLKGLFPYLNSNANYVHSLEFDYLEMDQVMTGPNSFNWGELENNLNAAKNRGNHLVFRVMVSWEYDSRGFPSFLKDKVKLTNDHPDWNDPDMLEAGRQLIQEMGKKYDGDPRIAYIEAGLVGYFGEWHTSRGGVEYPLMPTLENQQKILSWYDSSFNKTKIVVRYAHVGTTGDKYQPNVPGWILKTDFGMHDDSFAHKGYTLPMSMGGFSYSFLQIALNRLAENQWIKGPILGEVRPEVGDKLFNSGTSQDNPWSIMRLSHTTAMRIDDDFRTDTEEKRNWLQKMGYELFVSEAYFNDATGSNLWLGVRIENKGVAPLYYKWPVFVALRQNGNIIKEWQTDWDLTKVMPKEIKTFKSEWKTPDTVMSFGSPMDFESVFDIKSIKESNYELLIRVKSPLEAQTSKAKRLRFANKDQESEWLKLGNIKIDHSIPFSKPTSLKSISTPKLEYRKGSLELINFENVSGNSPLTITLYSLNGRILFQSSKEISKGHNKIALPELKQIHSGNTLIKVMQGNKVLIQTLLPIL